MVNIAETIMGWLVRVLSIFFLGGGIVLILWFVLDGVGHVWHRLGAFTARQVEKTNPSPWDQSVFVVCAFAVGVIWSYLPSYVVTNDTTLRGQFAYRWSFLNPRPVGLIVDYWIVVLEMIGLAGIVVFLVFVGDRTGIDDKVKRYHQRQLVEGFFLKTRRQHTTCEGCTYLQDKKSCHDRQDPFAAAINPLEGEARYCYRKQFWRGKRNRQ